MLRMSSRVFGSGSCGIGPRAASRPAASLSGEEIDERQFNGDDIDVAHLFYSVTRNLARERAFTMISDHAERVTRVGEALYERRTLSGDEIRELL